MKACHCKITRKIRKEKEWEERKKGGNMTLSKLYVWDKLYCLYANLKEKTHKCTQSSNYSIYWWNSLNIRIFNLLRTALNMPKDTRMQKKKTDLYFSLLGDFSCFLSKIQAFLFCPSPSNDVANWSCYTQVTFIL